MSVEIAEKRFSLPNDAFEDLATRLSRARLPACLGSGWEQGVPVGWLRGLLEDWRSFDPAVLQQRLDGLRQLRAEIDGQGSTSTSSMCAPSARTRCL